LLKEFSKLGYASSGEDVKRIPKHKDDSK